MTMQITISGAGAVGSALALALRHLPCHLNLIERRQLGVSQDDGRMIALSFDSIQWFTELGVWTEIAKAATLIETIKVIEVGGRKQVVMQAEKHHVPFFGAVVPLSIIENTLHQAILSQENITIYDQSAIHRVDQLQRNTVNVMHSKGSLSTDLLIAADGAHSLIRQIQHMPYVQCDYDEVMVIANVTVSHSHQQIAYECFSQAGLMALLPIQHDQFAVIMAVSRSEQAAVMQWDDARWLLEIERRCPENIGAFCATTPRKVFPLTLLVPQTLTQGHVVLIGNSAHALHPIAGQGLNLGIRDVRQLAQLLFEFLPDHEADITTLLKRFNRERRLDILQTVGATDALVRVFHSQFAPVVWARRLALEGVSRSFFWQDKIARFGMGLGR